MNKQRSFVKPFIFCLAIMGVLSASVGHAVSIGICDGDAPGTCTKSVALSGNTLTITLTNTSPSANSGFITADAFDLAGAATITAFSTTNANFSLTGLNTTGGAISVSPLGTREFLISTGGQFEGGGSPTGGIATGASATFTLTLGGTFSGVTEANVISSEVVRFRGFTDGGSDKDQTTVVPEPASVLLLGSGLVGIGLWGMKRRKNA